VPTKFGTDTLPVVSRSDLGNVVGVISRRIFWMPTDSVIRRTESKNARRAPVAKLVLLVSVIAGMRCDAHLSYLYCRPITVNFLTIGRLSGNLTCNSIHVGAI
jgi:hypothetical protein